MVRPLLKWLGRRYQRHLGVETPYFDEVVEHAPGAVVPILGFLPAAMYGGHLPPPVLHMVRLGATLAQGCGTCVEIERTLAVRDGVSRELVDAAIRGSAEGVDPEARVGLRFGERLGRGLDVVDERERLRARFGTRGVVEASIAAAGALTFPAVQRGMGYAASCELDGARPVRTA